MLLVSIFVISFLVALSLWNSRFNHECGTAMSSPSHCELLSLPALSAFNIRIRVSWCVGTSSRLEVNDYEAREVYTPPLQDFQPVSHHNHQYTTPGHTGLSNSPGCSLPKFLYFRLGRKIGRRLHSVRDVITLGN